MVREFLQMEPSMIAADWGKMEEEAKACKEAGAEILHLDVMDGLFVPNITMGPDMVAAIKRAVPDMVLDVHLMMYAPDQYIEKFVAAGADEITFHTEATEDVLHVIDFIKKCGKKVGLALKPDTSVCCLERYLGQLDKILIMTVQPGYGGQKFIDSQLEKVKSVKTLLNAAGLKIDLQVDGGINFETGAQCVEAGANRLVNGSHFFKHSDKKEVVKKFNAMKDLLEVRK